ncbi:phosphoadenosine phosphosulfate reductase family protein [Agrobacterium tumefaciens]|uniref:phosphoadenosine phosphosulfate reductase family protein n=1 Tax=Agrobacterium tumefaciens TaxID=358 RepID=UPI001571A1B6|nr:phosphoadenosine phosphosulfate reductase family protein [Agrobacterium tumefaciens]NSY51669.1 phosphoadenosine phosphosulfate reductase family protein [Agrobacterium tumefaciens]NTA45932.1 phosphoadenosine phosphosulfate reductase family protein [Agrobacterium tumefaciens]WCK17100.1 phosphoadenosine phosphosulfate reductase family protein [Agrobacterium tumefaciens]WIE36458.1 phosphoadenosine phosphosulfate reductase family protein [Agrobacterium tumefaciens]
MNPERHILGLSGGRDSAALAVFMRQHHPELPIEYFFTDTGKELPEVYSFLDKLEGFLGRPIQRLNPDRDFDFWLDEYGNFLPSPRTRWCTRQLKLRPLEHWLQEDLEDGTIVHSYVAIRADEPTREGYQATHPNMRVHLPLREAGIDRTDVIEILEQSDVGQPAYYQWRSRSGCTFCFYQQKIEWVRLAEHHPDRFAEAVDYEKTALRDGSPFTWSQGESLTDLISPERVEQIKLDYEKRRERLIRGRKRNPLSGNTAQTIDDVYGLDEAASSCVICHK